MKERMILVGAGGFGRELLWQLEKTHFQQGKYQILGFADDTPELQGRLINGYPVLGTIDWLSKISEKVCAVIAVGSSQGRHQIFLRIKNNPNIYFPTIWASDVECADSVSYGEGCIFCHSSLLLPNSKIGNFVLINFNCSVSHDSVVGDFCTLYPSVTICGNVKVGRYSEVGVGTNIIEKKSVGDYVTIGAGAAVVRDIPSHSLTVGVPAKVIKVKAPFSVSE